MVVEHISAILGDRVIELERRLSRAMQRGAGITLKAQDLDVLAATGAADCLTEAKARLLKERATWRQRASINEVGSTSTTTEVEMGSPVVPGCTSAGIVQSRDASAARARASAIFG